MSHRAFVCLLSSVMFCCSTGIAYSPPVRSTNYGPPGRLEPGRLDVSGASQLPYGLGGVRLAYGFNDWLQVEGGGDFSSEGQWAMGFAGVRFTPLNWRRSNIRLTADLELGAGLGVGGDLFCRSMAEASLKACRSGDDREPLERLAGGGYLGGGVGVHVSFFSLFTRGRVQVTIADGLPMTTWGSVFGGIAFDIRDWADIYIAGGVTANVHEAFDFWLPAAEMGISIAIPVRRERDEGSPD